MNGIRFSEKPGKAYSPYHWVPGVRTSQVIISHAIVSYKNWFGGWD